MPGAQRRLLEDLVGAQLTFVCLCWHVDYVGACEHCEVLACLLARDIVLFVPLQAPYTLF